MASPAKKLAFRRLLEIEMVDIIFLQETLAPSDQIIPALEALAPGWHFKALDVHGQSGGMALGYNPSAVKLHNIWGRDGIIGVDIFTFDLGKELRLINIYGPCINQALFWENLLNLSFMQANNIILGDDLIFSIGHAESWGHNAQIDPLTDHISSLLEDHHLSDIPLA